MAEPARLATPSDEAIAALMALGFKEPEARSQVADVDCDGLDSEAIVRSVLRKKMDGDREATAPSGNQPTLRDVLNAVNGLSERLERVEGWMARLAERMDRLEDRMERLEGKVDKLEENVNQGFDMTIQCFSALGTSAAQTAADD